MNQDRHRSDRTGMLFVDAQVPEWDRDGGSARAFGLLRLLAGTGRPVAFLPKDGLRREPYASELESYGIDVLAHDGDPAPAFRNRGPRLGLVVVARPDTALHYIALARRHAPGARIVYDTVDLHWVRLAQQGRLLGDADADELARRSRRVELAATAFADAALAVTEEERHVLQSAVPGTPIHIVSMFVEPLNDVPPHDDRRGLIFVGNFRHRPNVDAAEHFVRGVFPSIVRRLPGVTFTCVGQDPPRTLRALAGTGVSVTGHVPSLAPLLAAARVFVCPMRAGAGIKTKILSAMACGIPVVTTSRGAGGMGLVDGRTALIADTIEGFAAAAVRLHEDRALWECLSGAGLRLVIDRHSEAAMMAALHGLLERDDRADGSRPVRTAAIPASARSR